MDETPLDAGQTADHIRGVRFLRRLVTVLTATMIAGLIILIVLFVTRFPSPGAALDADTLPAAITLPPGTRATAFTQGRDWYAIVTAEDRILIYDRATGVLRQTVDLN